MFYGGGEGNEKSESMEPNVEDIVYPRHVELETATFTEKWKRNKRRVIPPTLFLVRSKLRKLNYFHQEIEEIFRKISPNNCSHIRWWWWWCESPSAHKGNGKFEYFATQLVVCFRPFPISLSSMSMSNNPYQTRRVIITPSPLFWGITFFVRVFHVSHSPAD